MAVTNEIKARTCDFLKCKSLGIAMKALLLFCGLLGAVLASNPDGKTEKCI